MYRSLKLALIALALNLGASAPALAETDAKSAAPTAARTGLLVSVYGAWAGTQRYAAECEQRGYDDTKAIRRTIEQIGVKYEAVLAEAKLAYEDEANTGERQEVDGSMAQGLNDFRSQKAQAVKRRCQEIVANPAALQEKMDDIFSLLRIWGEQPPAAGAEAAEVPDATADAAPEEPAANP